MKFTQIVILLPCRSLEDFALQREPDQSQQLLSAWSAPWHPALLLSAQDIPRWYPASDPPQNLAGCLVMLPHCSRCLLPEGWLEKAEAEGAVVVDQSSRHEILATAIAHLDDGPGSIDPELVADFLALGYAHFLVELLTRQLRYMSNLDEASFRSATLAGAQAAWDGDQPTARRQLEAAFQLLRQAREYFYPVDAHLLDLTLVAPTTTGETLRNELSGNLPVNLLVSGEVIEQIAHEQPDVLQALGAALQQKTAALIGGEFAERELPLLPPEAIRANLERGLAAYDQHVGNRPAVFGRRQFGLSPVLPQILKELGFVGALHFTLDDGRFPTGTQSRIQWEGLDGSVLPALARVPLDAANADTFLRLPETLGRAMDLNHVATIVFAHWPGHASPWYQDFKRIASYGYVLGKFETIDEYFQQTSYSGQQTRYKADQYRSPYLRQHVAANRPDPISRWVRYYADRATADTLQTLDALSALTTGAPIPTDCVEGNDPKTGASLGQSLSRFAQAVGSRPSPHESARLIANPFSSPRRQLVSLPSTSESVAGPLAVVDVPAFGFAWVDAGSVPAPPQPIAGTSARPKKKSKEAPPLAEAHRLQNEFFEIAIDPHTGAIRSISDFRSRGPRLAQQIALRLPHVYVHEEDDDHHYSIMTADEIRVTSAGPLLGEIVCHGRLVDREAQTLARFTQATRVQRGSRIIDLQIHLDPERMPEANPWDSYYAARFAWNDAGADLFRSVNLATCPTDIGLLEAPYFIDIRSAPLRTTILTGGHPYHRRLGLRKLDTLLVVQGETARDFRLAIGIDLPHATNAALELLAPSTVLPAGAPLASSGWLFHLDVRNVIATHWEAVYEDGVASGFRVRLLETDGRDTSLSLRSFRSIATAQKVATGETWPTPLLVEGDAIRIDLGPHQWLQVEAHFKRNDP